MHIFLLQTVSNQFAQLYMIFGSGCSPSEKMYPAVFMLLPSKSVAVNKHAFQHVKDTVSTFPKSISIEFKAAQAMFTNFKEIVGCRFHRKKNLFFQVGQKGCLSLFHGDDAFQVGLELLYTLEATSWEKVVVPSKTTMVMTTKLLIHSWHMLNATTCSELML